MENDLEAIRKSVLSKLRGLADSPDIERAHCDADDALCYLLTRLGYDDVVEEFDKLDKWYA